MRDFSLLIPCQNQFLEIEAELGSDNEANDNRIKDINVRVLCKFVLIVFQDSDYDEDEE